MICECKSLNCFTKPIQEISEKQGFGLNHKQSQYIHRECKLHFYCTTRPCFALWGSSGASKDANHNTNTSTKANNSKQ